MKKFNFLFALLGISLVHAPAQASEWINRSSAIFFPSELKSQIIASQNFPVFWWNFLVVKPESGTTPDFDHAHRTCSELKKIPETDLTQIQCETGLKQFLPIVEDYAKDIIFRQAIPTQTEIDAHLNRGLSQASLPSGDSGLIDILRHDPFETWKELKEHAEKRMPLHLEMTRGFLLDPKTGRILIPVQFAFSPTEGMRTKGVLEKIPDAILIGPHGSAFQNESRIKSDMRVVGITGFLILAIFAVVLLRLKMVKLIPLFGGVVLGTGISVVITKLVFGSIHGLTLSFGAAIAGLAMDYAFQAALNFRSPSIWKSNFCGFCTTTVGLLVVMFSSVPLLKQMMFFSLVAMGFSFSIFYLFFKYSPYAAHFSVETSSFVPKVKKFQTPVSVFLVLVALVGVFVVKPVLDLRQFDYQTADQKELSQWLYETTQLKTPIFEVHPKSEMKAFDDERMWADLHHVTLENRAEYVPSAETASLNQKNWDAYWTTLLKKLTPNETKFFAPFFDSVHPASDKVGEVPSYVKHLTAAANPGAEWITLWLPASDDEAKVIHDAFPKTQSLSEVVSIFPKMLSRELGFMVPISIILALIFHLIYYRRLSYATIALLPFFTGLGLIVLCSFVFHFSLSFISVIALILVFGFSLDYGIFATDACIRENEPGMWTGITLAAFSTVAGFVPLAFCKHPVLRDLGITLFLGGVGTYLGAIWAVPHAVIAVKKAVKNAAEKGARK